MNNSLSSRLKNAWNVFFSRAPTSYYQSVGTGYSARPDRVRLTRGNERSIVTSVYNRMSMDVAAIDFQHATVDENGRFKSKVDSGLNRCLTLEANIDQTGRAFIQDVVMSMFDEGCVAIVPVDTDDKPNEQDGFDILSMRTGRILDWYPAHIRVEVYNERTGLKEEILIPKYTAAIIENPLYAIMNRHSSTMQRLIRKLNLLDVIDEQSGSGKLNLIMQLPYAIKSKLSKEKAEMRLQSLEEQLKNSKYGIAYADATERITQLNGSVDNNLMTQIEYLTSMLYSQLGITQSILDGSADEQTMLNYYSRTIEPILSAITGEMNRKFLCQSDHANSETVMFFRDPFKLVPISNVAEIADKFTRNEIMTSNEMRQVIGMIPSSDPKADELRNKNLSEPTVTKEENQNGNQNESV